MRLSEALRVPRGITAAVGGGGKTALLKRLADELSQTHTVLLATTTHMWPPACETLLSPTRGEIAAAFRRTRLLAVGSPTPEGKLARAETLPDGYEGLADYVLVEADGSRGMPLKAPDAHEPALPGNAALVIAVAGMSCAGLTVTQAAHRPALYAGLACIGQNDVVTPRAVARVLTHPQGQKKGVTGRYLIALNQADTLERIAFARAVARLQPEETVLLALEAVPNWAERWLAGARLPDGA